VSIIDQSDEMDQSRCALLCWRRQATKATQSLFPFSTVTFAPTSRVPKLGSWNQAKDVHSGRRHADVADSEVS
jgi:hypothetical protein